MKLVFIFSLITAFWKQQLSVDNLFKNVNFGLLPELINQTLNYFMASMWAIQ